MTTSQILILLSTALAFISPFFYAHEILKGEAQPHRTTRLVLLVITGLAFFSLLAQHNQVAVWLAGVGLFQSTMIFLLSLKFGMGGWEKLDILCLVIAALGIVIWQVTKDPVLALYASILADFTGVFPTLVKSYHHPESESFAYFFIDIFAAGLNLLAVQQWSVQAISYPLYLTLANVILTLLIVRPQLEELYKLQT